MSLANAATKFKGLVQIVESNSLTEISRPEPENSFGEQYLKLINSGQRSPNFTQ